MKKIVTLIILFGFCNFSFSGCWLLVGAAGAEGGYIASQDEKSVAETVSDQVTSSSVKTRLLADPDVSGLTINVDVDKGVATLRGYVKTNYERERAIELANSTSGVTSVDSRLVVDSKS